MQEKCRHHIEADKQCPWCERPSIPKSEILSAPKKLWQFYQGMFHDSLNPIADECQGPVAIAIVAEDMNGKIYSWVRGPETRTKFLAVALEERLKFDKEQKEIQKKERAQNAKTANKKMV